MQEERVDFMKWALPKLHILYQARCSDARAGRAIPVQFLSSLEEQMADFENQPFARPDFAGNLTESGAVRSTAPALRHQAEQFFRHNSLPHRVALLGLYKRDTSASEECLLDSTTAIELWAAMDQSRIRELARVELGVDPTTRHAQLPAKFHALRKEVAEREFAKLSAMEQADWADLADQRKRALAHGETDFGAVQDAQTSFESWLYQAVTKKLADIALGDIVIRWEGSRVGPQDNSLTSFHGQVGTLDSCPLWSNSAAYIQQASPAWEAFVKEQLAGKIITKLPVLDPGASAEQILERQKQMESFLEDLFKVGCKLEQMNKDAFWSLAKSHPHAFVSPQRLPAGVVFRNPRLMDVAEFRSFYMHVWRCFEDRDSVHPRSRFVYEASAINLFIGINDARKLKARWNAKKEEASDTDSALQRDAARTSARAAATGIVAAANVPGVAMDDTADFDDAYPVFPGAANETLNKSEYSEPGLPSEKVVKGSSADEITTRRAW